MRAFFSVLILSCVSWELGAGSWKLEAVEVSPGQTPHDSLVPGTQYPDGESALYGSVMLQILFTRSHNIETSFFTESWNPREIHQSIKLPLNLRVQGLYCFE